MFPMIGILFHLHPLICTLPVLVFPAVASASSSSSWRSSANIHVPAFKLGKLAYGGGGGGGGGDIILPVGFICAGLFVLVGF